MPKLTIDTTKKAKESKARPVPIAGYIEAEPVPIPLRSKRDVDMARDGFLPARRCAELARCADSNIYRAAEAGKLEHRRVGSGWYIQLQSFRSFLGDAVARQFKVPEKLVVTEA